MPEFVCGLCENTVRKTPGTGVVTTVCARCGRELSREANRGTPEDRRLAASRRSHPIRQELETAAGSYSIFSRR
jgi:hypothetical protein